MLSRTESSLCVFKQQHTLQKRCEESQRILSKYEGRIPIIVEISESNKNIIKLDKAKYLVPDDLTVSQFMYVIRKRVKLEPETAMFIFFNNAAVPATSLLKIIYHEHKDEDGFLYATVSLENAFG